MLEGLTAAVTRKAMLAAQIGEKLGGGSGTPGSHILVAAADALDGFREVLALLLQIGGQNIVEGRGRVLAAPFGVLFQLRLTFRLEWDHIHGGLGFLLFIVSGSAAEVKSYLSPHSTQYCSANIGFPLALPLLYTDSLDQDTNTWIDRLRSGDARALARAISTVENRDAGWSEMLKALFPHTGKARVIGLTGAPGSGKSTLVDQLAKHYRKENQTVGIIAVDPTSPYTGGAILGDRIRMQDHYSDPGISIRSMATRGSLGGMARATADAATVLDASGRDLVMIETVGVGQDEVDIVRWPM